MDIKVSLLLSLLLLHESWEYAVKFLRIIILYRFCSDCKNIKRKTLISSVICPRTSWRRISLPAILSIFDVVRTRTWVNIIYLVVVTSNRLFRIQKASQVHS